MKRRVIVLGSTGSIGCNTLDVLERMADEWQVVGLAAGSRWERLAEQAKRVRPEAVALTDDTFDDRLRSELDDGVRLLSGEDCLGRMVAEIECDAVVIAVVGVQALPATLEAARLGRRIALANKESIVIAGSLLTTLASENGATIVPIDSEHSAIFQAIQAGTRQEVQRIYLTASGGPFRTWSAEAMERATLADALNHPTWDMGPKVTIDSATMMNKALEIVEARWLFDVPSDKIEVVVHPESIIHSCVEFCDGSIIAQLGAPDMRTPIQYALTYPRRLPCPSERLDLLKLRQLNLYPPDPDRFPALRLGHEVARRGGTCGAVLNGANEMAVELFRRGDLSFGDITRRVQYALERHEYRPSPSLDEILTLDRWAREEVAKCTTC